MDVKVFKRGCRFSAADRVEIEAEIERGRCYYNDMIGALNRDIAGVKEREWVPGSARPFAMESRS